MLRECFFVLTLPVKTAVFVLTLLCRVLSSNTSPTKRRSSSATQLHHLNDSELLEVMSYLTPTDLYNLSRVCKRFAKLFQLKMKTNRSVRNVNKDLNSSVVSRTLINEYKSMFKSAVDISLHYGKFLNVLILNMPRIRDVWLDGVYGVNDRNLYLLGDYMPCLVNFWLFNANISDTGLERFFRFAPKLEKLVLKSVECRGHCFNSLGNRIKSLSFLLCWGPEMNGFQILSEKFGDQIEELTIVNKAVRGDEITRFICDNFHNLSLIYLRIRLTVQSFNYLRKLTKLRHLQMMFERIPNNELISFQSMNKIKSIHFEFTAISDEQLARILSKFVNLDKLSLFFDGKPTNLNQSLQMITSYQSLQKLSIKTFKIFESGMDFRSLRHCRQLNDLELGYLLTEEVNPLFDCFRMKSLEERKRFSVRIGTRFVENFNFRPHSLIDVKFYSFWDRPANSNPMLYFIDLLFLASIH